MEQGPDWDKVNWPESLKGATAVTATTAAANSGGKPVISLLTVPPAIPPETMVAATAAVATVASEMEVDGGISRQEFKYSQAGGPNPDFTVEEADKKKAAAKRLRELMQGALQLEVENFLMHPFSALSLEQHREKAADVDVVPALAANLRVMDRVPTRQEFYAFLQRTPHLMAGPCSVFNHLGCVADVLYERVLAFPLAERQELRSKLHQLFQQMPDGTTLPSGLQADALRQYLACRRVPGTSRWMSALWAPTWRKCGDAWCTDTLRPEWLTRYEQQAVGNSGEAANSNPPKEQVGSATKESGLRLNARPLVSALNPAYLEKRVRGPSLTAQVIPPKRGCNILVPVNFMGIRANAVYDTGSAFTYVDELWFPSCAIPGFRAGVPPHLQAVGVTGHGMDTAGSFRASIRSNGASGTHTVLVSRNTGIPILLGLNALWAMRASFVAGPRGFEVRTGRPPEFIESLIEPSRFEVPSGPLRGKEPDEKQPPEHRSRVLAEALCGTVAALQITPESDRETAYLFSGACDRWTRTFQPAVQEAPLHQEASGVVVATSKQGQAVNKPDSKAEKPKALRPLQPGDPTYMALEELLAPIRRFTILFAEQLRRLFFLIREKLECR